MPWVQIVFAMLRIARSYFGSMPAASLGDMCMSPRRLRMYTMFQIITLESWSQAWGVKRQLPSAQGLCAAHREKAACLLCLLPAPRPRHIYSSMLRLFLFLTTFGILNIIVGVIVENTLNAAKQNQELQDGLRQDSSIYVDRISF